MKQNRNKLRLLFSRRFKELSNVLAYILIVLVILQGCVTPGVGRHIRDLENHNENRESFHIRVMSENSNYYNIIYKKNGRIGVIFNNPSKVRSQIDSAKGIRFERYMPDTTIIEKCEIEIFEKINNGNIESKIFVQSKYVKENYNKYLRQYFGSIEKSDTLIEIKASFYEGEMSIFDLFKEMDTWGGGARYWHSECHITNNKVEIKEFGTNWIE